MLLLGCCNGSSLSSYQPVAFNNLNAFNSNGIVLCLHVPCLLKPAAWIHSNHQFSRQELVGVVAFLFWHSLLHYAFTKLF